MKNKTLLLKIALAVPMLLCVLWLTSCSEGLETNLHEITESFTDITVNANTANVTVAPTDGDCLVECIEKQNVRHEVSVIDGELKIEFVDNRKFYEKIFGSWKADITLYLPKANYNSIALFTDTGHIKLSDNSFNSVAINTSTGEIDLEGVKAKDGLIVTVDTGDVELKKCEAASISVETDTGDINFEEISEEDCEEEK